MKYLIADTSTCNEAEVQRLLPLVPLFRREQALRFKHVFGQWACLKTWTMLQELVGRTCDDVYYGSNGKPYLKKGPFFSISHCKSAVAVVIDEEREIGIDIESGRHAEDGLIQRTMNKDEQALIAAADDSNGAFLDLWTQKEAVLKARGTGIVDDLTNVLSKTQGECVISRESWSLTFPAIDLQSLPHGTYVSIATIGSCPSVLG